MIFTNAMELSETKLFAHVKILKVINISLRTLDPPLLQCILLLNGLTVPSKISYMKSNVKEKIQGQIAICKPITLLLDLTQHTLKC